MKQGAGPRGVGDAGDDPAVGVSDRQRELALVGVDEHPEALRRLGRGGLVDDALMAASLLHSGPRIALNARARRRRDRG